MEQCHNHYQIFQSSLPRGERLFLSSSHYIRSCISILAPTRGATPRGGSIALVCFRFQSSLPRGERPLSRQLHPCPRDFNPRSHEGSDLFFRFLRFFPLLISILAPTRGATAGAASPRSECNHFNPRSHEGSDVDASLNYINDDVEFQSSLPRGERLSVIFQYKSGN